VVSKCSHTKCSTFPDFTSALLQLLVPHPIPAEILQDTTIYIELRPANHMTGVGMSGKRLNKMIHTNLSPCNIRSLHISKKAQVM
jgi:hypothetical protein